jgi:hypothetical protein
MRVYCYHTWAVIDTQEQIWLCSEAVGAGAANTAYFYIREDRLSWAFMLDPTMRHMPKNDYYI